jgi:hypothetical protein
LDSTSCSLVEVYRRFGVSRPHQDKNWKRCTDFGRKAETGPFSKRPFQGLQISLTVSPYSYYFADFNSVTPLLYFLVQQYHFCFIKSFSVMLQNTAFFISLYTKNRKGAA